jgi:acyl transferase domain-containing protein/aryl carrier-like protein
VQSLPHPREDRSDVESLLGAAGRLWTSGVTIAWDSVRSHRAARRVPLPTYPFERKRHWVDAAASPSVSVAEIAPVDETRHDRVDDWFYTPTWSRAPLAHSRHTVPRGTWLVFARADELSARVLDALDACGARGIRVEQGTAFAALSDQSYMVRATTSDDYDAVLSAVQAQGTAIAGIIHLWNVGSSTTSSVTTSVHALAALSWALLRSASLTPIRLVVATSDAQSVLGEDIAEPARAMIAGAVMVLPVEHEYVHASAIDLDQRAGIGAAVDALLREAGSADASSFVAQRVGQRFIRRVEPTPLPPLAEDALPLTPQGVYLLTGGLGGIGATLAQWLATQCGARLILTARTPLPPRAEWDAWLGAHDVADETAQRIERVRQVEACGGAVRVIAAEVSDLAAMRDEIAVVEAEWGPVNGIVHAAGVPSAGLLGLITDTDIDAALDAKVNGLNVLVSLFGERQLDFVVLCSSINAVLGNPGAFAYTAANAWLDAFAVSTHRPAGWPVTSIAWDAWNTVGMATKVVVPPAMRAAREAIMRNGIRPADGADAFARALASRLPLHVVSPWTVTAWRDMRSGVPSSAARIGGPSASDRDMAAVGGGAARTAAASASTLEASLMAIWRELLGEDDIGIDDNFFELGGHSLLATRVLARVTAAHGVRLTLRTMFEAPTVRQFAVLVAAQQVPVPALADGADGSREEFEL